jgi:hypothetical protein
MQCIENREKTQKCRLIGGLVAGGKENGDIPDAADPGQTGVLFGLATPAEATKFKKFRKYRRSWRSHRSNCDNRRFPTADDVPVLQRNIERHARNGERGSPVH